MSTKHVTFAGFLLFFTAGIAQGSDKVASILQYQEKLNEDFRNAEKSPLTLKDRDIFTSLDFFPVDTSFIVEADFVRTPYETPFEMPTTTDRKPVYVKYGEAYFELDGKDYKLNLYQNRELIKKSEYVDYLFLPFTDLTNGTSTYAGGRYVDMRVPETNKIIIDFNKAYNPYCAYNGEYSCPIPPSENHLDMEIAAGVRAYYK